MSRKAVFMDRDGTISYEVGYVNHPSRYKVFPWSAQAVAELNRAGWLAFLVTNQAGVARGYFSAHHPSVGEPPFRNDCECRKPKPGLIHRAAKEFDIDLANSWMIGDRYSDVQLARNAGVNACFVLSGYGLGEWEYQRSSWETKPDLVAANL